MAANIYVYCPPDMSGPDRYDLEERLETFFGDAAENCGAGSGEAGYHLDYELAEGEDPHEWADRLRPLLLGVRVRPGTVYDVFPDGWDTGREWRRVEVFGKDERRTDDPTTNDA